MKKVLFCVAALGGLVVWACWKVYTQPIEWDMQDNDEATQAWLRLRIEQDRAGVLS